MAQMKRAILCFPSIQSEANQYPTGLYRIASTCKDEYAVIVLDQRLEPHLNDAIRAILDEGDVLCLGLSVMTGEQIGHALEISREFHNQVTIVWGGIHPSIMPKQVIENNYVDYVVMGEGELAFLNLIRYLDSKPIPSELFLSKTNRNYKYNYDSVTATAYVDFDKYPVQDAYFVKRDSFRRAFPLETSRGCPHHCYFCHNSILRKPYRAMNGQNVVTLIDDMRSRYNLDGIIFQEDNFFANKSRVEHIIKYLSTVPDTGWKANSRIDYFSRFITDDTFMSKLVDSGCRHLQFGIESGSPRIIEMINKRIDIDSVRTVNMKLASYPIDLRYNFIIGFPGESIEDMQMTFSFISTLQEENANTEPPLVSVYAPYPGTRLYPRAIELGFKEPQSLEEWSGVDWRTAARHSWLTPELQEYIEMRAAEYESRSKYAPYMKGHEK